MAGKEEQCLVRIACRELESWYLADLAAIERAYQKNGLSRNQEKEKFRNPDRLSNPVQELRRLVPEFQKISGARMIAPHMDVTNTRSRSFTIFIQSLRNLSKPCS